MGMRWQLGNPDAGPAGGEVIHRGDLQHRDRLALQRRHDAAAFPAGQRGDRQQNLIELLLDLTQHLGRLDRDAVDRAPPETRRIIEKDRIWWLPARRRAEASWAPASPAAVTKAAGRHWQTQHHAKARQQQHQQSMATSEPVESAASDVAREGFVLPGEGKQRQANQQHRWQQPQAGSLKAGMERMGQSQHKPY